MVALAVTADPSRPDDGRALSHDDRDVPVLDLVHLSRQTFGDPTLERDVLTLFVRQARECAQALACTNQPQELSRLAHLIKGSARGVGAIALSQAAGEAEAYPENRETITRVKDQLARARERAERLLAA